MWIDWLKGPVWAPEDEGAGGDGGDGGDGGEQDTTVLSGDGGVADGNDGDTGDGDDVALDGGTADGDDNSDDEGEGDSDAPPGGAENEGVPDEYTFDLSELGDDVQLDEELAEALSPTLKELGLSNSQANVLATAFHKALMERAESEVERITGVFQEWKQTAQNDQEIGQANWQKTVQQANAVLRKFGTPELVEDVMVGQGMGNHPEMIRFVARVANAFSDDVLESGKTVDTGPADQATAWYGKTTPTAKKG